MSLPIHWIFFFSLLCYKTLFKLPYSTRNIHRIFYPFAEQLRRFVANRIYWWWLVDCSKSIKSVLFKDLAWWILIASSPKLHANWAKLLWQINWGKQWQGQTQDWRIKDSIWFLILGAYLEHFLDCLGIIKHLFQLL